MDDFTIFIIGCFILCGILIEVLWSATVYVINQLDYFFYHRYLDKVSKRGMMEYMDKPHFDEE